MAIDISDMEYAAKTGDHTAELFFGIYFFLKKNFNGAFKWFKRAADNNSMLAQYFLSSFYKEGLGIKENHVKAFGFAECSARQGFSPAQIMLSQYYKEGIGVDKNPEKANKILIEMAESGNARAALHLGMNFDDNFSFEEAIKWYLLANKLYSSATTTFFLGAAYEKANNNKKALEYYIKATELGSSDACIVLAIVYSKGLLGVETNQAEAKKYSNLSDKYSK